MEDYKNFFNRLKEQKLYIIEFEEDNTIKPKIYPTNYAISEDKQ